MEEKISLGDYQKLLNTAIDLGHFLLEAGAETYRVEESIQRVLYAYGIKHVDVFAITNSITVTITMADDTCFTRLRRIYSRGTNYQMIEDLNNLSRYICIYRPSVEEFRQRLKEIYHKKGYPFWMMVLAFAGVGFSFTLFFGGNLRDALVATLAGALIRVVIQGMERVQTNGFFINLINSLLVTLIALLAVRYQIADHSDRIIIGTLMSLVPGVAVTNAMRDIIAGDLVAGTMKGLEALLVALALALGTGMALVVMGGL
ncbi:MAG: threonine/serine exporter ThrE family protein [Peptococcaceae bacterium]